MFWPLAYQGPDGISVVLQPAADLTHAKFAVDVAKLTPGEFTEGHKLDAKMIRRIPKDLVGRRLTARQAQQLLKKLAK